MERSGKRSFRNEEVHFARRSPLGTAHRSSVRFGRPCRFALPHFLPSCVHSTRGSLHGGGKTYGSFSGFSVSFVVKFDETVRGKDVRHRWWGRSDPWSSLESRGWITDGAAGDFVDSAVVRDGFSSCGPRMCGILSSGLGRTPFLFQRVMSSIHTDGTACRFTSARGRGGVPWFPVTRLFFHILRSPSASGVQRAAAMDRLFALQA